MDKDLQKFMEKSVATEIVQENIQTKLDDADKLIRKYSKTIDEMTIEEIGSIDFDF